MKKQISQRVVSVKQYGPRWLLLLGCGHVLWVTSKRRPVCKTAKCGLAH